LLDTVPAVAMKVALVAPAESVTEAGTVRLALLSDSVTAAPSVGAAFDRVTVQLAVAPETTDVGEHCNVEIVGDDVELTVMTPPAPETDATAPSGRTPKALVTGRDTELPLVELSVAVITATTPFPITVPFIPLARQLSELLPAMQLSDLPAAVRTGPLVAFSERTSLGA
jgi:hypothetical protein